MLAFFLALLIAPRATDEPFLALGLDAALKQAAKAEKIVFIDFRTSWCRPCKKLDRTTWRDVGVREWLKRHTIPIQVDAEEQTAVAERYSVQVFPTLLFVDAGGNEIERIVGYVGPSEFQEKSAGALAGKSSLRRIRDQHEERPTDPSIRQSYARALARAGQHEAALEHFLWCFDHGQQHSEGYKSVRTTFLLSDLTELGRDYPPAMTELAKRRDAAREQVTQGSAPYPIVADFVSLNRALDETDDSLAVLDGLKQEGLASSRAARLIADLSADLLLRERRYADLHEIGRHDLARIEKRLRRFAASQQALDDEELLISLRESVVRDAGVCFEVLLGLQRTEEAERALELVLDFDMGPTSFVVLLDHAVHAYSDDFADRLVAVARGRISGDAGERLAAQLARRRAEAESLRASADRD